MLQVVEYCSLTRWAMLFMNTERLANVRMRNNTSIQNRFMGTVTWFNLQSYDMHRQTKKDRPLKETVSIMLLFRCSYTPCLCIFIHVFDHHQCAARTDPIIYMFFNVTVEHLLLDYMKSSSILDTFASISIWPWSIMPSLFSHRHHGLKHVCASNDWWQRD